MRKYVAGILFIFVILLVGCSFESNQNYVPKEQPHLYWKDIDVVVTDIDKRHWFATVHRYEVNITVHSEEYNISKTLNYQSSGAFAVIPGWDYEVGDVIKAELYSWVMDSTGEVMRRDINKIY